MHGWRRSADLADGTQKWSFGTLGGATRVGISLGTRDCAEQIGVLPEHRRAADCLPDAQAGWITLLTIQACLPT
jgi:hypothetical protein